MPKFLKYLFSIISVLFSCHVYAQLHADFDIDSTEGCTPLTVHFTDKSTGGPTSWTWSLGVGGPVTLQNASAIYNIPNTYTITLTVTNGTSTSTKQKSITVHPLPVVNFTASPLTGCATLPVTFTDLSTPGGSGNNTYTWYWGDNTTGNSVTPPIVHPYTTGPNTVVFVVTNSFGCTSSLTRVNYITINQPPVVTMNISPRDFCTAPACVTTFSGSASGPSPTFAWFASSGTESWAATGASPPSHCFIGPAPASYTVKLVATDANGCKDSLVIPNYINIYKVQAGFTAPAAACIGAPVNITTTATPASPLGVWNWNLGNGTTPIPSPIDTYFVAGTYKILQTYSVSGCTDTTSKFITIYPRNNLNFTTVPDTLCPAPTNVIFHPTPTGLTNYAWTFGDPTSGSNTSAATNPSHLYQKNGFYDIILTTTDNHGCRDTFIKAPGIKIYDLVPCISQDKNRGCIPVTVHFGHRDSTNQPLANCCLYPYPMKTYQWDFGDPASGPLNVSTSSTPTHIYNDTGLFRVIFTETTINNCTASDTTWVSAGYKPLASFTAPDTVCYKETVLFTGTAPKPLNLYWWVWDFNNPPSEFPDKDTGRFDNNAGHHFSTPKIDTVALITEFNGCPSDTFKKGIVINFPKAVLSARTFCNKDSLLYVQFGDSSVGEITHVWHFGDGDTSIVNNPLHKYPGYGSYTPYLVAYNSTTRCDDTAFIKPSSILHLFNKSESIAVNDTTVCIGDTLGFKANYSAPFSNPPLYSWFVNNSFKNVLQDSFTYVFPTTGNFSILVQMIDEHTCIDNIQKNILVSKPNPVFTTSPNPAVGCTPFNVVFPDLSTPYPGTTIANRFWDYGNGVLLNTLLTNTSASYINPNSYNVKLVLTDNNGCKDSSWQFNLVQAHHPVPNFSSQDTGCIGNSIGFFNASVGADTSRWSFGDNSPIMIANNTAHTYNALGSYTVKLYVKDTFGCKDSIIKTAKVTIIKPVASFTMNVDSVTACLPAAVTFHNTSSGNIISSTWDFGDGSPISTLTNPTHPYSFPGYDTITLIVMNAWGCSDTVKKHINLLGYSGSGGYGPLLGCSPMNVTFHLNNLQNVPSITWDFNDGVTANVLSTSPPIIHTYQTPGAYLPKLVLVDSKNCKTISPGNDTIRVDASYPDFKWGPACEFGDVQFMDQSHGLFSFEAAWTWKFDNGQTSSNTNPVHHYGAAGDYPVKVIAINSNGCADSIQKIVTVHPLPIIDAGADTIICLHDSATLTPSGGISYEWSPNVYISCTSCTNPLAGPPVKYMYTVIGTDDNGCKNTDSIYVSLKTKVTAIVAKGGDICDLDTIGLHVSGAKLYVWTPPDGLDNNKIANPVAAPHHNTTYTVVSYEGRCIPDTDAVKIVVHPLPTVKAKGEQTIIAGNTADLQASGDLITKFLWAPPDDLTCADCPFTTAKPNKTTTFTIYAYTDFGCVDSDHVTVTVLCDKSQLFMPNTFTPNGDGQNDVYYPRGVGLAKIKSFRIFNRWGEIVFQKQEFALNDKSEGWDGTYKGAILPPDVFVYIVDAYCDNGEVLSIKGDVSLVR